MSKAVCINITIAEIPGRGRQERESLPSRAFCLHVLESRFTATQKVRCVVMMERKSELSEKSRCVYALLYPEPISVSMLASGDCVRA